MSDAAQNSSTVKLHISGLISEEYRCSSGNEDNGSQEVSFTVSLPSDTPLSSLWSKIEDAGFQSPGSIFEPHGKRWSMGSRKVVAEPFDEVKIVEEKSTGPEAIGLDETLITFTNRYFGVPLQLNVDEVETSRDSLSDCLKESHGLEIMFLRTARMPDDDKLHPLPAALGTFPLYSVDAFAKTLPEKMVREGGVFMPMWQREALWIGFECKTTMQYALRVHVGRINAISGKNMHSDEEESQTHQDYVVIPGQDWLDGICVGPGVVRQFVAMPLGSGYTVEGQKTDEEDHGGLQLEIIPAFESKLRTWLEGVPEDPDDIRDFLIDHCIDELLTPRQLGLHPGAKLRLYPSPAFKTMPCSLSDITGQENRPLQLIVGASTDDYRSDGEAKLKSRKLPRRLGEEMMRASSAESFAADNLSWIGGPNRLSDSEKLLDGIDDQQCKGAEQFNDGDDEYIEGVGTKNLRSMGLAAGGKLMQDIIEDRNPAKIWNTAASRLAHIHLLDPASCEAVTHIVPAPPPIDAETYAKSNMPFYVLEEKPDERLEGGDFDNVKSVSAMDKAKSILEEQSLDPTIPVQCRCGVRLCDCVECRVRSCNHTFCHICIKELDPQGALSWSSAEAAQNRDWKCPICQTQVVYVAGFSSPMNLPGEESIKMRVPVNVLEVRDGRPAFKSVHKARI